MDQDISDKMELILVNLVTHLVTHVLVDQQLNVLVVYLLIINLEPHVLPLVPTEPSETKTTDNVLVVETTSVNIVELVQVPLLVPSVKQTSLFMEDIVSILAQMVITTTLEIVNHVITLVPPALTQITMDV